MLLERSSIKPKGFYGFIKPEVSTRAVDGRRGSLINVKNMYNNDGGEGGVRVYEAYEVK